MPDQPPQARLRQAHPVLVTHLLQRPDSIVHRLPVVPVGIGLERAGPVEARPVELGLGVGRKGHLAGEEAAGQGAVGVVHAVVLAQERDQLGLVVPRERVVLALVHGWLDVALLVTD